MKIGEYPKERAVSKPIDNIRTLQVHMSNLRKKIEMKPDNPKYIVTIRSKGYKFSSLAVL